MFPRQITKEAEDWCRKNSNFKTPQKLKLPGHQIVEELYEDEEYS